MSCEISIVCSCRNDNYGENLLDRLYYFMRSIDRFTSPIELILVEWNPLDEYEPIADIISKWNDEVKFKHPIRIITVSKENHERFIKKFEYTEGYKSFQEYPSKNVGIRHAKGTYIIQTNPDIFYPLSTIKFIEHMIKTHDFYGYKLNEKTQTYEKKVVVKEGKKSKEMGVFVIIGFAGSGTTTGGAV